MSAGWNEPDTPVDEPPAVNEPLEKVKKRYRKKKTKLEEAFPSYLQVNMNKYEYKLQTEQ